MTWVYRYTFKVNPFGVLISGLAPSNNDEYLRAHVLAARFAARNRVPTFVTFEHTDGSRGGLGPIWLARALGQSAGAYWDAKELEWRPLPEENIARISMADLLHTA